MAKFQVSITFELDSSEYLGTPDNVEQIKDIVEAMMTGDTEFPPATQTVVEVTPVK